MLPPSCHTARPLRRGAASARHQRRGDHAGDAPRHARAGGVGIGILQELPDVVAPAEELAPLHQRGVAKAEGERVNDPRPRGQGLLAWGLKIMAIIAITVIFAMGVLYILSAGNSGMMQTAKGGMIAALIGFAVMLSAYLIVNVILTILVDTASPDKPFLNLTATQGYFNFACDITSNVNGK
jgi:hypothetical protein